VILRARARAVAGGLPARPWPWRAPAGVVLALAALASACGDGDDLGAPPLALPPEDPRSGGDTTVYDLTRQAYAQPAANLSGDRRDTFFIGNAIFNRGWVTAPASVADFDGLGPLFNASNCSGCHFKDGRGRPPLTEREQFLSMLVRLSVPGRGEHGEPVPDPGYGDQLQNDAVFGMAPEGRPRVTYVEEPGTFADGAPYSLRRPLYTIEQLGYGPLAPNVMLSPRVAPAVFGLGLLEAIPEQTIVSRADPDDADGDGISGRPNRVWDVARRATVLGRFGWKANQPDIEQQNEGAFLGDMGITSARFPAEVCTPAQAACSAAATGPTPQLRESLATDVLFYMKTLGVPGRRRVEEPGVRRGARLFAAARCTSCHVPETRTGVAEGFPELSLQVIRPYSDLLLHDMGEPLADGRPDFEATGSEWRTPPLWGIGLVHTVNQHTLLLHDGRARNLTEAILWHGGEAARAREAFRAMPAADRGDLVRFLESL